MVFDSSQAKIELKLENKTFSPGDKIRGKITLKLNKPIKAKNLTVTLKGKKYCAYLYGGYNQDIYMLHKEKKQLSGEKEYFNDIFAFEFKIPENILQIKYWKNVYKLNRILIKKTFLIKENWKEENNFYLNVNLKISLFSSIKKRENIIIREQNKNQYQFSAGEGI